MRADETIASAKVEIAQAWVEFNLWRAGAMQAHDSATSEFSLREAVRDLKVSKAELTIALAELAKVRKSNEKQDEKQAAPVAGPCAQPIR